MDEKFEYPMRYFELHANQRMTTFNFFIVLSALLTTALVSTFDKDFSYPSLGYAVSIAIIWVSVIFWKLDQRVKFLIKHAEEALSKLEALEAKTDPEFPDLFTYESKKTSSQTKKVWQGIFKSSMSYSQCFEAIYLLFGVIGISGILTKIFILMATL